MDTAKKQTVVVEVMALVGGHLLLPKVKLSKYIPADYHTSHQGHTDEPSPGIHLAMNASPSDTRSSQAVTKDDNKSVLVTSSNEKTSSVGGKKMRFIFSNSMFDFGHLANLFRESCCRQYYHIDVDNIRAVLNYHHII